MTTWDEAVTATARELAHLMTTPAGRAEWGPDEVDIEVALTARAAVLAGAATVLGDLAPRTRQPTRHGRRDLLVLADRDPLRALGLVLRDRGRAPAFTRSPSELLDAAAPGAPATRSWAAAGRHALIGDRIWTAQSRNLDADHAWHVVRQVTALAELVARLDPMLVRTAQATGKADALAYLDRTAGLRVVAHETAALSWVSSAGAGKVSDPARQPIRAPEPARPITPHDGPTAVAATRRLTGLLRAAGPIAPHQVRAVAHVGRDLAVLAAASGAVATHGAEFRDELAQLATCLNRVVTGRHGEAALTGCPAPAVEGQVRELAQYTRDAFACRMPRPDGDDATRLTSRLPKLVTALTEKVRTEVDARRWAIPDRSQSTNLHYAIASNDARDLTPRMLAELQRSGDAAGNLLSATQTLIPEPLAIQGNAVAGATTAGAVHRDRVMRKAIHPAVPDHERLPPTA